VTLPYDSLPVDACRAAIDILERILAHGEKPPSGARVDCAGNEASNIEAFVSWDER
jgi:hypothetical protein